MTSTINKKISLLFIFFPLFLNSQSPVIFPGLTGEQLQDSLVVHFKTQTVLSYADARDTLFARIYTRQDSLRCVYSGYAIYMDPGQDPNTWAYNHGIDTEHTWPQSKGAVGQSRLDMHHMYPTRILVNSSRGNDPFAENPDNLTDRWFRQNQTLSTIPGSHIEEYSEKDDDLSLFEPREDHKGNVARAMFYFYTMYHQQADSADPGFFPVQKNVLYQWHGYDPVDSLELIRTQQISFYQDGYTNPFVLDSSLIRRAYFSQPSVIRQSAHPFASGIVLGPGYPNPFNPRTTLEFSLVSTERINIRVYNLTGQLLASQSLGLAPGVYRYAFDGSDYPSGIYFIQLVTGSGFRQTRKVVLQK